MLVVEYDAGRPGPGHHVHGWTTKQVWVVAEEQLSPVLLRKRRWLHVETGKTSHDRPVWDIPQHRYGLDVVVAVLARWLLVPGGLHTIDWAWSRPEPARRTVQRWRAFLTPFADSWLQAARERIIDYVAPRPLEELLPTGGIPPPAGRTRSIQVNALACKLRDVVWIHENVARALRITLRRLLGVARWRWPKNSQSDDAS